MRGFNKLALGLAIACAGLLSAQAKADTFVLRMGGGHTTGLTYVSVFDGYFAEEVAKRAKEMGHTVRFIKAWGGSVAKVDGAIEAVQRGTLDIGLSPIGFEQTRAALLNYSAYVPFPTDDPMLQARVSRRMIAEVPELQASMQPYKAMVLAAMVTEAYGIATNFDWNTVEGLKGRKLAMAGTNAPLFTDTGAVPVNLGIGEHYTAMQTGLADGSLFYMSGMEAFRLKEVAKTWVKTGFGSLSTLVAFMSTETRAKMPADLVAMIDTVAAEAAVMVAEKSKQRDIDMEKKLVAEGISVHGLADGEQAKWAKLLTQVPKKAADDLESRNLPGRKVLREYIRIMGEEGYRFPVDYPF